MSWIEPHGAPAVAADRLVAAAAEVRASFEARCRSTARADRAAAERGVRTAYAAAGLAPPRQILWCDSPVAMLRAACLAPVSGGLSGLPADPMGATRTTGVSVKAVLADQLAQRVSRAVEAALPRQLRSRLWQETRSPLAASLARNVREAVETGMLEGRVRTHASWLAPLRAWIAGLRGQRPSRAPSLGERIFCSLDAGPLFVLAGLGSRGILTEETAPLDGLRRIASEVGWMLPCESVCWLAEWPTLLSLDTQQRLHAPDGPALRFADGWSWFAWKGVRVPTWMIEHKQLVTAGLVDREHDPVLRRCMIDIMTPARYIASSAAICVSRDEAGSLWLKTWHHWDSWAAVEVVNGTAEPDGSFRRYVLQVPPTMRTAREAVAWTYGLAEHEYARLRLRT